MYMYNNGHNKKCTMSVIILRIKTRLDIALIKVLLE